MKDGGPGLRFRETMAGGFALGATEPRDGERGGEQAGTSLTLRGAVVIRDLDRFVADPDHRGELVGHVSFPPLGENLPGRAGVFQPFSPAAQPETKYMVYELGFEARGKSYYLAGKKEVRNEPGFDLWSDTTTLFTRLHEGDNAEGPVVGAGVLRLGLPELLRLISSMTASNAGSAGGQAKAVQEFGRLFLGELWGATPPR